jgi:ketosteroid isomerase-like protein
MLRFLPRTASAGIATVLVACAGAGHRAGAPGNGEVLDSAGIGQVHSAFAAATLKNDPALLASFYADSALFLVPGLPTLHGRAAVEALFRHALLTTQFRSFVFVPQAMFGGHGTVTEVGEQRDVSVGETGRPTTAYGRYLITWVRTSSGAWQMAVDVTVVDSTRP